MNEIQKQNLTYFKISYDSNRSFSIIPSSIEQFNGIFKGIPISQQDVDLLSYSISGKSRSPKDFVGFWLGAPVISENALTILLPYLSKTCQFFFFGEFKRRKYFILNVINLVHGLDVKKSECTVRDNGEVISIWRHFISSGAVGANHVFKLIEDPSLVFVSNEFISYYKENNLTGLKFNDPMSSMF